MTPTSRACSSSNLLAIVVGLVACDHGPAPEPTPSPTPVAPADPEPPRVAEAPADAPVPTPAPVDASAPAVTPPVALGKTPSVAGTPRFELVAALPEGNNAGELRLFGTANGDAFAGAGFSLLKLGADGSIEHDARWTIGFEDGVVELDAVAAGMSWFQTETIGGTWPDGAVIAVRPQSGSRGGDEAPFVYRRSNARWIAIATREKLFDWYPRALAPWKDGSLLALKAFEPRFAHPGDGEEGPPAREVAASNAAIAKQKRLVVLRGAPKAPAFGARNVVAFDARDSGEIVAAIASGDTVVMLHHSEDGAIDRELVLPGRGLAPAGATELQLATPTRAFVLGTPPSREYVEDPPPGAFAYVARFDGSAWIELATECSAEPYSLSIDRDGTAYFLCPIDGSASRETALLRVRDATIEEISVDGEPTAVLARAPDDIWVVLGGYGDPWRLLHTGTARKEPFVIPDAIASAHAVLQWADPHPLTEQCSFVWIPLEGGADRKAIAKRVDGFEADGVYPSLVDAKVADKVVPGVIVRVTADAVKRSIAGLVGALGDGVGTPICNAYPPASSDTYE